MRDYGKPDERLLWRKPRRVIWMGREEVTLSVITVLIRKTDKSKSSRNILLVLDVSELQKRVPYC